MSTTKHRSKRFKKIILDSANPRLISKAGHRCNDILSYYWDHYNHLEFQRNKIHQELRTSLISSTKKNYTFSKWQRTVKWKYSNTPLSPAGSISFIGGRFNMGKEINTSLTNFPALYIADSRTIAMQEALCDNSMHQKKLNNLEIALKKPESISVVSVSGQLDEIIDLTNHKSLTEFTKLIQNLTISSSLKARAKLLGIAIPGLIDKPEELRKTLLTPNWQMRPAFFDVPSNSQIFGHITYLAGIGGILYPSKYKGGNCLAIFTNNFKNSSSFIEIDDQAPANNIITRVDSGNYNLI